MIDDETWNQLRSLAKTDPVVFEKYREKLLTQALKACPGDFRKALTFQADLDLIRERHSPEEFMKILLDMIMNSVMRMSLEVNKSLLKCNESLKSHSDP